MCFKKHPRYIIEYLLLSHFLTIFMTQLDMRFIKHKQEVLIFLNNWFHKLQKYKNVQWRISYIIYTEVWRWCWFMWTKYLANWRRIYQKCNRNLKNVISFYFHIYTEWTVSNCTEKYRYSRFLTNYYYK